MLGLYGFKWCSGAMVVANAPYHLNMMWLRMFINICHYRFHATLYPCPEMQSERREMAMGVMTRIEDLQAVCM